MSTYLLLQLAAYRRISVFIIVCRLVEMMTTDLLIFILVAVFATTSSSRHLLIVAIRYLHGSADLFYDATMTPL